MTAVVLSAQFAGGIFDLTECLSFRLERDRFTPYTRLTGQWFLPDEAVEPGPCFSLYLTIDGQVVHSGFPVMTRVIESERRKIFKVSSYGYSQLLMKNQCADGLVTKVNLEGLISASGIVLNGVEFQPDTPEVNYVNYYNGTTLWDGIVSYSLRSAGTYPYLSGYNLIRITTPEPRGEVKIDLSETVSRENTTDFSRMVSKITMRPIDGEGEGYVYLNTTPGWFGIVRCEEIPFDREWIMDPEAGLSARADYSMRKMNSDFFTVRRYVAADLMDVLSVPEIGFEGDVCGITVAAAPDTGILTTFRCDHDNYSY